MTYSAQLLKAIEKENFSNNHVLLKKALNQDSPEILSSLAEQLTDRGFTDLAKTVYRALIAKFPKEDLFKVYLGEILLNDGYDDDGLSLLYNVAPSSDAYLESLLVQADYYQSNGLLETAKDKLLRAQKIAPHEDAVKFGLAELAHLKGDDETALGLYRDLIKRQSNFGEVNLFQRLFETEAKLGNYEQAAQIIAHHHSALLDIDSKYQAGLIMLALHRYQQASKYLEDVLKQSPDYVNAYPLLAKAYAGVHNQKKVLEFAQKGLSYNELDETLYSLGAEAAINLGNFKTAGKILRKGLKIAPENDSLRLQLSNLYLHQRKDQANLALFKKSENEDIDPQVHWNMALSYVHLHHTEQARSEFLLAYPEFKNNASFLKEMIHFFQVDPKNKKIVKELIQRYLRLKPEDMSMRDLASRL